MNKTLVYFTESFCLIYAFFLTANLCQVRRIIGSSLRILKSIQKKYFVAVAVCLCISLLSMAPPSVSYAWR